MTIHVELKHARALNERERTAWRMIQGASERLTSPYFALDYFDALAEVRGDVRVVVQYRDSEPVVFLPLQLSRFGHARPLGGPLGDHHGVISQDNARIDLRALLSAAGIAVYDFYGLVGGSQCEGQVASGRDGSWVVDLSDGIERYVERQKKPGGNTFRTVFASRRKLLATGVELEFCFDDRSADVLDTLMGWKSDQYAASGHFDVFSAGWTRTLLKALRAKDGRFGARGVVSSLKIDGQLAAAHFGMLGDRAMHYWFPGYDSDLAKAAPGNVLLEYILEALADRHIDQLHLGPGDYRYKSALGCWQFPLDMGYAATQGPVAMLRRAASAVEAGAEGLPLGAISKLPGKAFRRIDKYAGFRPA